MTDNRTTIQLEFSDEDLLVLCLLAHERDLTLNKFCEKVIEQAVKLLEVLSDVE